MNRRKALAALALSAGITRRASTQQEQDPFAHEGPDEGDVGRLNYPWAAGQSRARVIDGDNDPFIIAIEEQIKCNCGCAHSLYACRTTDFSCQFWQPLHASVVAMAEQGNSAEEIIAAYAAEHGEEFLMAPPPEGFNLAGYALPGVIISLVAAIMIWVLGRRQSVPAAARAQSAPADGFSEEERQKLADALKHLNA